LIKLHCYVTDAGGSNAPRVSAKVRSVFNPLTPTVAIWIQLFTKHPVPDRVKLSLVIFDIQVLWRSWLSKITNDGLTQCGTGCFIAVTIWQQWASEG